MYNEGYSDGRKSTRRYWGVPGKTPWSTITYANGPGFLEHFNNDPKQPWKDIRNLKFQDLNYRSPAFISTNETYASHGGEDVPIIAKGPWAHLFTGKFKEIKNIYVCYFIFFYSFISYFYRSS